MPAAIETRRRLPGARLLVGQRVLRRRVRWRAVRVRCVAVTRTSGARLSSSEWTDIRIVLAEDNYLVREGIRLLIEAGGARAGGRVRGPRLAPGGCRGRSPTWCSPTSACRRRAPTRACGPRSAPRQPPDDRRGRAQPVRRARLRAGPARKGLEGRAYLLKERVSDVGELLGPSARSPGAGRSSTPRWSRCWWRPDRGQGVADRPAHPARRRSWPRWPRARTTPPSPRR